MFPVHNLIVMLSLLYVFLSNEHMKLKYHFLSKSQAVLLQQFGNDYKTWLSGEDKQHPTVLTASRTREPIRPADLGVCFQCQESKQLTNKLGPQKV